MEIDSVILGHWNDPMGGLGPHLTTVVPSEKKTYPTYELSANSAKSYGTNLYFCFLIEYSHASYTFIVYWATISIDLFAVGILCVQLYKLTSIYPL